MYEYGHYWRNKHCLSPLSHPTYQVGATIKPGPYGCFLLLVLRSFKFSRVAVNSGSGSGISPFVTRMGPHVLSGGAYTFSLFRSNAPNEKRCIEKTRNLLQLILKFTSFMASVTRLGLFLFRNSNQSQFTLKGPSCFVIIQTSAVMYAMTLGARKKAFTIILLSNFLLPNAGEKPPDETLAAEAFPSLQNPYQYNSRTLFK